MYTRRQIFLTGILVILILTGFGACNTTTTTTKTTPVATNTPSILPSQAPTAVPTVAVTPTSPAVHAVELDIMNNIKAHGFQADPSINNGMGGLNINWRYGSNPLQVNVNGTGETDDTSGATLRHDDLTDLRYLHNLWSYKVENPGDSSFDSEMSRYTPIIKHEFLNTHNERGWIYDILIDIYALSHDSFYKDAAMSLAKSYAKAYDPAIGMIYKKNNTNNTLDSYRTDNTLEAGCALIQAGTLTNDADWIQKGKNVVDFLYKHAYIPQYHTFPGQIGNVLQANGQLNPAQPFYAGLSNQNYKVDGGIVRMGNISQIIISLLDTYQVTREQDYLNKATDLLDALSLPNNTLKMWDTTNGGYFYDVNFSGSSPSQPGTASVDTKRKEAGRQAIMLQVYHLADKLTNNHYQDMENRMRTTALNSIYSTDIHGVTYLVNADWSFQKFKNGTYNNMDTTEAMGAELESLFYLSR
jgi:hypothetical protein